MNTKTLKGYLKGYIRIRNRWVRREHGQVIFEGEDTSLSGLYISGFSKDNGGKFSVKLEEIKIPRRVGFTIRDLFSIRGINPVAIERLTYELRKAREIPNGKFPRT